ncbi:MAG: hydrogenase maturation protease [Propionibacteriaceae bacterium]|jgi:hydrogenase maturation protease|nr:hydrogenase maturation protease [Propionibacteriaceae bacterium]
MLPKLGSLTVLAVGNPIMSDDGLGQALLAAVQAACPDTRVTYVDGGIAGLELLPVVQDASHLLILDAIAGDTPGAVHHLSGDQLPRLLSAKLGPHEIGLLDVFTSARLLGQEPEVLEIVGITPASTDLGIGLAAVVAAAIPAATEIAVGILGEWLSRFD